MTGIPVLGRRAALRIAALVLLLSGLGLLAHACWIPAKAVLAQVLLQNAWQRGLQGEADPRPWPWADATPVARLTIDGEDFIVLSGGSGEALAFAPSHLPGSAAPGAPGLSLIAGHRDTHFSRLGALAPGSEIRVQRLDGGQLSYRVTEGIVVSAETTSIAAASRQGLGLVTCWPLGSSAPAPQERFILFAVPDDGAV